jgi:hypothetical protein
LSGEEGELRERKGEGKKRYAREPREVFPTIHAPPLLKHLFIFAAQEYPNK